MGFDVMKLIYSDRSALQSLLVNYFARIFLVENLENTLCFDSEVAIGIHYVLETERSLRILSRGT